ncbi:MAG TPA: thiamine-monophosphate kinase, partial [Candidatus Synoicihabitans sp.]|nr:thiamine-monophosphate kinase [Candidatus Synoicihabitans sp.]
LARQYRVPVIGGDVAHLRGGFVATLTLVGEAVTDRVLTRNGARRGDWIYVTGRLGGSRLGHHWRFEPRLAEGAWLAGRAEVRALMDVSDGLAKDVLALTPGGAVPTIWADAVPVSRAAQKRSRQTGRPALTHAVSDGEDFELLFMLDGRSDREAFERAWRRRFPVELTCIGRITTEGDAAKESRRLRLEEYHGYEHLG